MKKYIGIIILLIAILLSAFTINVEKDKIEDFEIIAIHDLKIKPGVDEKEFEAFVLDEIAPIYNKMKGQHLFLGKGYVGQRWSQYSIFITFETVEDRNRIYPLEGGFSEEFHNAFENPDELWKKFRSMAEGFDGVICTDYLKIDK